MGFQLWVGSVLIVTKGLLMIQLGFVVGAPSADLISSLPGQPKVGFRQYAGYVTVDKKNNRNLFYYFVEAAVNPQSMPVSLWLTGGPGCSSLGGGGFSELGPFYPTSSGTAVYQNPFAWNQISNVLFLESPAGVGFSYSDNPSDYSTNDAKTGEHSTRNWYGDQTTRSEDALKFLLGWFDKFPEYKASKLFITGEGYAGHYVPQLATAVLENYKIAGQPKINLQGVLIGNPLLDYVLDTYYGRIEYLASHGMISEATKDIIQKNCKFSEPQQENKACQSAQDTAREESQFQDAALDPYDVLADVCVTSLPRQAVVMSKLFGTMLDPDVCIGYHENTYLNLQQVQSALHTKATNWSFCSNIDYDDKQSPRTMVPTLQALLQTGLRIWIMSGDADFVIPVIGTRKVVNSVAEGLKLKVSSPYRPWYQGQQVGGWWTSWGKLAFISVRGAGHMIPRTQGARGLQIFRSFLSGSSLPTTASTTDEIDG